MTERETEIRDAARRFGWTQAEWRGPAGDRYLIAARPVGGTWLSATLTSAGAVIALSAVGAGGRALAPASVIADRLRDLARAWAVADIGAPAGSVVGRHPYEECGCSDAACPCDGPKRSAWPVRV